MKPGRPSARKSNRPNPTTSRGRKGKGTPRRAGSAAYRLVFENNPLPMFIFALDSLQILTANDAAIERYGYTRDEFLALTIRDIRPPEQEEALNRYLATPRKRLQGAGVWKHRLKDGTLIDVEIISHALEWDGRAARLVTANDVTVREQQAQALRDSEALKSAVLESAVDAIIVVNEAGRIEEFNPAAETMFGYPREAVLGNTLAETIIPPALRAAHEAGFDRFHRTGKAQLLGRRVELSGLRSDQSTFPVELSIVRTPHGSNQWFTGFIRDITERKQAEERILALTEHLEQQVEVRTQQLEAANKELEAFSYSVSHDLRAPLRSIDGFSLALLQDFGAQLDDKARHYLTRVRAATERMGLLIDDLLGLARVTRTVIRPEPVELSALAADIADALQNAMPDRHVSLTIEPDIVVTADKGLLRIALSNVLANAWKYTTHVDRPEVYVGQNVEGDEQIIYVRDNGAGFDMQYVEKLFGAFQRLHSQAEFEGHGIGLATVQRIVRLHGGRCWAEGAVKCGATFYMTFGGGINDQ